MNPETAKQQRKDWIKLSRRIIKARGNRCEECFNGPRMKNPLMIRRLDHDSQNNKEDNLIVLCTKCHQKLHRLNRAPDCQTRKYQLQLF